MLLFLGLILFIGLVLVHEWGHFIVARRNGVEVEEFGLFFPPRMKTLTKKNGTEYTLNWLPLGGFVKLKGENDADRRPGTFGAARFAVKAKILLAGVGMNLLTAFVMLTLLALIGMPKLVDNQFTVESDKTVTRSDVIVGATEPEGWERAIGLESGMIISAVNGEIVSSTNEYFDALTVKNGAEQQITFLADGKEINKEVKVEPGINLERVEKDSPAHKAGVLDTDSLLSIAGQPIFSPSHLTELTEKNAGNTVALEVERDGKIEELTATLRTQSEVQKSLESGSPIGYVGIVGSGSQYIEYTVERSTWSAPIVAGGLLAQFTTLTFQGLGTVISSLFAGDTTTASEQVAGPVGVFAVLQQGSLFGFEFVLLVIAVISLSLAIMNVLPIPALDGGRLFVLAVSRAIKKPLTKETEELVHGLGFMFLLGLIVLITYVDINRFY